MNMAGMLVSSVLHHSDIDEFVAAVDEQILMQFNSIQYTKY